MIGPLRVDSGPSFIVWKSAVVDGERFLPKRRSNSALILSPTLDVTSHGAGCRTDEVIE